MEVKYVPTTCPYCGTGCGFNLVVKDKKVVGVAPWHRNPVNEGKLCPKGNYAAEFINSPDRLTKPLIKKDGKFVEASWDEAYKLIASKFKSYKGEEMACLASARVSNEENYLMQKFARAVLKTPNIDHCARLCHASTVVGLAGAFGSGAMTQSIADIAESKCLLIIGSNTFETHPLIGRRVMQAKAKGAKVIYADPRFTPTGKQADLYLPFYSGTDVAILNCFMQQILKNGWENKDFVAKRTKDFEKVKEIVMKDTYSPTTLQRSAVSPKRTSSLRQSGLANPASPRSSTRWVSPSTRPVSTMSSRSPTSRCSPAISGRPGTGICALRGQNNVQGACDMGALANVYSGYQAVIVPEMRKKMMDAWGCEIAEGKVGLTVTKLINTLADKPGKVKCVYIMGENPMISDPDLHHVEKGMKNVEFMVVQDIFLTETAKFANVVLPAACYAEKDGTQTNTERRVQKWRKAQDPPGEAKADWQIFCELAKHMGFEKQFPYKSAEEVFTEISKVTPSYGGMNYARLEKPEALHWPCPTVEHPGTPILHKEKFTHPDGLGIFTPIEFKYPAEVPDKDYPMILTTGRCIWQWHTGTMTRRSESLEREEPTGWVEINPEDAKALNIKDKEMVKAITRRGEIKIGARVTPNIKKGVVFIPFHYGECAANTLTNNALDPVASIPEFKACAVRIEKIPEVK